MYSRSVIEDYKEYRVNRPFIRKEILWSVLWAALKTSARTKSYDLTFILTFILNEINDNSETYSYNQKR